MPAATADDLSPHGGGVLIAGTSGIGKSTLATALTERFVEQGFQFCVLDPEGDYDELENAVVVGDADNAAERRTRSSTCWRSRRTTSWSTCSA